MSDNKTNQAGSFEQGVIGFCEFMLFGPLTTNINSINKAHDSLKKGDPTDAVITAIEMSESDKD